MASEFHNRNLQDAIELHIWGKLEYVDGRGAYLSVTGTGTRDYDIPVMNFGYGANLPADSDVEVLVLSDSSDTNGKVAVPTIPFKTQRKWPAGAGGVQAPMDGERALEFNKQRTILRDKNIAFGANGALEMKDGDLIIRGKRIIIDGDLFVKGNLTVQGNLAVSGTIDGADGAFGTLSAHSQSVMTQGAGRPVKTPANIDIPDFEDKPE